MTAPYANETAPASPQPVRIRANGRRPKTGFFLEALNLIVQHFDFPLHLGLGGRGNQRLATLELQLGDFSAEAVSLEVDRVERSGEVRVGSSRDRPEGFRGAVLGCGALEPDLKLVRGLARGRLVQARLGHRYVVPVFGDDAFRN